MEAASRSPAGNGIDQGRGQWEGAHHAPRTNLNVSQGRGGERRMFPGDAVVSRADGARKVEEERKML